MEYKKKVIDLIGKNIVLTGMPGAGKSTIGVVLAKMLGYQFIDSDLLIQNREGDILEHLIEKKGIEGFIALENMVNCSIEAEKSVISTGGSICYCGEALEKLGENGVIIYIKTDYASLKRRLRSLKKRGVVMRRGSTLRDLYDERVPLYEKYADVTVDVAGLDLEESIEKIYGEALHWI